MDKFDLEVDPNLNVEIATLIAALADGTREWRENLEVPSQEAMMWSPYPNGPSIGGLILHMASCEQYWLVKFAEGAEIPDGDPSWAYDETLDQFAPHWPLPPNESLDWYYRVHDEVRVRILETVRAHADPYSVHLGRTSSVTYRWILAHLVEHDSYHGGQAVLLHEMYKKLGQKS